MLAIFFLLDIAAAAPGAALMTGASGSYTISDTPDELHSRTQSALQSTLAPLNFAMRAIAENRLEAAMTWCSRYDFTIDDKQLAIQCDEKPRVLASLNGEATSYTNEEGTSYSVTARAGEDHAVFTYAGQNATQVTTYRFSSAGLQVTKEIQSSNLEVPLRWQINYTQRPASTP